MPEAGAGSVGSMLLAEDLLLLVTDDASGRLSAPAAQVDAGLGRGGEPRRAHLDEQGGSQGDQGKPGRIIVRDPSPAGDEVLDAAVQIVIAHQGKKPSTVIGPLSKNLRRTLYERLAGAGVIRAEQGSITTVAAIAAGLPSRRVVRPATPRVPMIPAPARLCYAHRRRHAGGTAPPYRHHENSTGPAWSARE